MKSSFNLILLILSIFFSSCKVEYSQKNETFQNLPNIIQKNYSHNIYKNRKKYLFAKISNTEFYEKKKIINCEKIYAEIYDSKEKLTTTISSDKAVINNNDKKFLFSDNVELEMFEKETKLYSAELELDYDKNKMKSAGAIVMKKKDGSYVKADSMESDVGLEITSFKNMEIKYFYDEEKKK